MKTVTPDLHAAIVMEEIQAAGERFQSAREGRIRAIRLGRAAGLTWDQVGRSIGTDAASCIQLLKRAEAAA